MRRGIALFAALTIFFWGLDLRIALLMRTPTRTTAETDSARRVTLAVSRGYIYDKNFVPLVNGERIHSAVLLPFDGEESALRGNPVLSEPHPAGALSVVRVRYLRPDSETAKYFDEIVRYPAGSLAVHLIGYTDSSGTTGVSGLEKSFDELLNARAGRLSASYSADGAGKAIAAKGLTLTDENYDSKGGLQLTLDSRIQSLCEKTAVDAGLDKGAIVVLRADTAEIAALASFPAFDRADLGASLNAPDAPFLDRALESFSVGSIFKVVTAAAALENGFDETYSTVCTGQIDVGGVIFPCHKHDGHGELTMSEAMACSCNTYFISLALAVGADAVLSQAKALGFGEPLEPADGLYADGGTLPERASLNNPGELANLAFGQGTLSASPLQMAAVYACIASGGVYRKPYVLSAKLDDSGRIVERYRPEAGVRVMREETAEKLRAFLKNTVETGSGSAAKPSNTTAAGKTATAQSGQYDEAGEQLRTWFCGYFPAESPRYVVAVLKEDGTSPIADCAPIFRIIAEGISTHGF